MEWITIEEFNKDPRRGFYWVFYKFPSGERSKGILERGKITWWNGDERVKLSNATHVMPIKEPQDP